MAGFDRIKNRFGTKSEDGSEDGLTDALADGLADSLADEQPLEQVTGAERPDDDAATEQPYQPSGSAPVQPIPDDEQTPPWGAGTHGRSDADMSISAKQSQFPIGLALGSGGARGWAHIGVLHALEKRGIVPDIICGTSAGALVGGIYTAGRLDALEEFARSLSRRRMMRYFDLAFGSNAFIGGKRLTNLMEEKIGDIPIEALPRRFVAVTTELATGHEIWLRTGRLVDAMQASYAIPGIFAPEKISGRWLIDGGLVNPVPVSVCRAFGARLVIAVNLNADVFGMGSASLKEHLEQMGEQTAQPKAVPRRMVKRAVKPREEKSAIRRLFGSSDETPGMGTVLMASFNIMQDRLSRSRLAGDPPDVTIAPRIADMSMMDFHEADELIKRGEEAVEPALPFIEEALRVLG